MSCKYNKDVICNDMPCNGCTVDDVVKSERKRIIEQLDKAGLWCCLNDNDIKRVYDIVNGKY